MVEALKSKTDWLRCPRCGTKREHRYDLIQFDFVVSGLSESKGGIAWDAGRIPLDKSIDLYYNTAN